MAGDPRLEPVSVNVLLTTGEGVAIEWRDGHRSRYAFSYLRKQCPCATCREQRVQKSDSAQDKSPLPLYQEPARALAAEPVGNYAVRFDFSDGHRTGIYSFEYFREICPCEKCSGEKGEKG